MEQTSFITGKKITVAGVGYVGLSLAVLLSQNNEVTAITTTERKAEGLNKWISPIQDDEIERFFREAKNGERKLNLTTTTDKEAAYRSAEIVIIATPTNYDDVGQFFDTSAVEDAIECTLKYNPDALMIIKSTIPVGYTDHVMQKYGIKNIIFSPEFLRESKALYDNLHPSRIIVGAYEDQRENAEMFAQLLKEGAEMEALRSGVPARDGVPGSTGAALSGEIPIRIMNPTEAEAVKLFANTYLAVRVVVNLGAQAGVRYSITNPDAYIQSNMIGFYNILEACRHSYDNGETGVEHLVYASSSSVYGTNKKVPYSTDDKVDNPVSLYAATKKSNELMAHAYSKLYNIPSTGLRFFTVYGPAGRPDMAYFGFTNKLLKGQTIQIFNYGNCKRDFTYVDDIVEGVKRVMQGAPEKKNGEDGLPLPPYAVYNIGNNDPVNLLDFVDILQQELIRVEVLPVDYDFEAHKELVPMQPGDVPITYADTTPLERDYGFKPNTSLRTGLRKFAEWYKEFYR